MSRTSLMGILAAVLCLPVATVAFLGYRLIQQDRDLESQRIAESRAAAAGKAAETFSNLLSDPALLTTTPLDGALLVRPGAPLLFRDRVTPPDAPPNAFNEAEALEFQRADPTAAAAIYRKLAQSSDQRIQAGALYRLGRTLAHSGHTTEALSVYDRLGRMESASAAGWPAPLAAAWSRCRLLESTGAHAAFQKEAVRLYDLLLSGRYPLSRAAYIAFIEDAVRWSSLPRPRDRELLTEAALKFEAGLRDGTLAASGRAVLRVQSVPITTVWSASTIFAATPAFVEKHWLPKLGAGVWLRDDQDVIGTALPGPASVRHAVETHLPWTIAAAGTPVLSDSAARRKLLLVLLIAVGIFSVLGAYVVVRALRREFALARMQQDFVAAVSHEFRTPLTTLRQLTESLEDGRITSEEKRNSCYRSLSGATQRLHRLVEDLLDFRKMQSGAFVCRPTRIEVSEFTEQIVSDFQRETVDRGFRITATPLPKLAIQADREALTRAIWNLLDNAVKYSGKSRTVELVTECRGRAIQWSVRDYGIGIPAAERGRVFQKFFRGEEARRAGIRGTGIGLAMVQQIATAHGGRVSLTSEPGTGSVFTISIPCEEICRES